MTTDTILKVNNLHVSFRTLDGIVDAVRGVTFNLKRGETLAIVGESGSGKSVSMKAISRVLPRKNTIFGKVFCPSALSVGTDIVSEHRGESVFGQVNPALIFFSDIHNSFSFPDW